MRAGRGLRWGIAGACLLALGAGSPASAVTRELTIGGSTARSCASDAPLHGPGVTTTRWAAPADSSFQALIAGGSADDWDLALFDAAGRRVDASLAYGSNEVVQSLARRGETFTIQDCRLRGSGARQALAIDSTPVKLTDAPAQAPGQSAVEIPITSPLDVGAIERLGINTDEAPNGKVLPAVLGPGDAAKLNAAGFTYRVVTADLAAQDHQARAADATAAAAGPSPLPTGRSTYRHYPDIQADLKKVVAGHPGLAPSIPLPK